MKDLCRGACSALLSLVLAGCATTPTAPSVAVMPAPYKPFEVFQTDDAGCRQFAQQQVSGTPTSADRTATGAIAGAALGAAAGALIGQSSEAAGVGAGAGLLLGAANANSGYRGYAPQRRFDIAYQQCMYAKGNQVPGYAYQSLSTPLPPSTRVRPKK